MSKNTDVSVMSEQEWEEYETSVDNNMIDMLCDMRDMEALPVQGYMSVLGEVDTDEVPFN